MARMSFILLAFVVICVYVAWYISDSQARPPGPFRFPLVGSLPQILLKDAKYTFVAFHRLAKTYGPIMRVKVGMQETVVISDMKVMQVLLTKDNFLDRHVLQFVRKIRFFGDKQDLGVVFSGGDVWKTGRSFMVKNLRDFGFGKKDAMETKIEEELENFMLYIDKQIAATDGIVDMHNFFHLSLVNILWSMVAAKSFDHDDPKLLELIKRNDDFLKSGDFGGSVLMAFPFAADLFPRLSGFAHVASSFQKIVDYLKELLDEMKESKDIADDKEPNSFIDAFLKEIDSNKKSQIITEKQCLVTLMDLFNVGAETTSNSLSYIVLNLVRNPEIQEKVFREVQEIMELNGCVKLTDENRMPYTSAVIFESLRLTNVVPLPPPRVVVEDCYYENYWFPKGTPVINNMYSVLMDEKFWTKPNEFQPDRFLGERSEAKQAKDRVNYVFGFGKRVCPGEQLARTSLFLYLTSLVFNFKFENISNTLPSIQPTAGYICGPQPYSIRITRRTSLKTP